MNDTILSTMTTAYTATGMVLGNLWGGGTGAYSTVRIDGKTREEIIETAKQKLSDGSLDSGMGFESLIGARLFIDEIREVLIEGEVFCNVRMEEEFIGELTEDQMDFLSECF